MTGTTPNGLPYPEGTDLVVDGDNAIQALAEAVDARLPDGDGKIQGGTVTIPITDGRTAFADITFPVSYATAPIVVATSQHGWFNASARLITRLGARLDANYLDSTNITASPVISWIAIPAAASLLTADTDGGSDTDPGEA